MNRIPQKSVRILAIAPTTRGFGFAVLEGEKTLVDWGAKRIAGNKNKQSLALVKELMSHYQPGFTVLPDTSAKDGRRAPRIQALTKRILALAGKQKVSLKLIGFEKVRRTFFGDGKGTKHALAEILAERFPEELGPRLPPKRRPWMSEDHRMDIFDAVALALMLRHL